MEGRRFTSNSAIVSGQFSIVSGFLVLVVQYVECPLKITIRLIPRSAFSSG
jgi:hypothetical protein